MHRITDGTVHVFTYKDGLLSRLGHDLRLSVRRFEVTVDGESVTASFDATSLEVDGAVRRDGSIDPKALSRKDVKDTLKNTEKKVLHSRRHPQIRFTGQLGEAELRGDLRLVGMTRGVVVPFSKAGGRLVGEVELAPSRWGIPPFKALMGALKIIDKVKIRFDLPDPEVQP